MGGRFSFLHRSSKKKETQRAQSAGQTSVAPAAGIGNQAMLGLLGADQAAGGDRPAGGVALPGREELEQRFRGGAFNNQEEPAAGAQRAEQQEAVESANLARTSLSALYTSLKDSKRGGLHLGSGNSELYNAVMSSLGLIDTAMRKRFTADVTTNLGQLYEMEQLYGALISACSAYTARAPKTAAGQARKDIVLQIQAIASRDMVSLGSVRSDFCKLPPQEQSNKDWNALLDETRTVHLRTEDFSKLDKAGGGQASEVYKLKGSNTTVAAGQDATPLEELHFFKPEDEIDLDAGSFKAMGFQAMVRRYPDLPKKDRQALQRWYLEGGELPEKLSPQAAEAKEYMVARQSGMDVTVGQLMEVSGIREEGGKANTTRRNVATSRMASLLGVGGLVARSETAEMHDEATGKTVRGNLMEKAKGMEYDAYRSKHLDHQKEIAQPEVTGGFQRDMVNLQVLDYICGQVDRHQSNMMYQADESGKLTGLQGIDNDAAFGTNLDVTVLKDHNRSDRRVFDPSTGELTLPYMDKNLAMRIRELDPKAVRFALAGLLTEAEVEAAVKRLEMTKASVTKGLEETPEKFLEDEEWNDDTALDLIESDYQAQRRDMRSYMDEFSPIIEEEKKKYLKEHPDDKEGANKFERTLISKYNVESIDKYYSRGNYFGRGMLQFMGVNPTRNKASDTFAPRPRNRSRK